MSRKKCKYHLRNAQIGGNAAYAKGNKHHELTLNAEEAVTKALTGRTSEICF